MNEAFVSNVAPRPKWFQTWWGIAAIAVAGSVAPQLCGLLPNIVASGICSTAVRVAVVAVSGSSTAVALPTMAPQKVVQDCPPERRLSNGYCMDAVASPTPEK